MNVHYLREQIEAHLAGRDVHVSVEAGQALGTAGALGHLRGWIAGEPVLVTNADAWLRADLDGFVADWDGERCRLLVVEDPANADFEGRWRFAGASLQPWRDTRELSAVPSGLYEAVWREAELAGRLDLVPTTATFLDCGTPRSYWAANMDASGGESVVGPGAVVEGRIERCVVWAGAVVAAGEHLVEAIRADQGVTVRTG